MSYKVVSRFGTRIWYNDTGDIHREDDPAVKGTDGYRSWYINGKRHREDGPAVDYGNGHKEWWINNVEYTQQEYKAKMRSIKLKQIL